MDNPTILITFHPDTMELDVDAPAIGLDVVISFLQRALRQCENAEKIAVTQQASLAIQEAQMKTVASAQRTREVLSKIKLQ